jgi:hypothetical protein
VGVGRGGICESVNESQAKNRKVITKDTAAACAHACHLRCKGVRGGAGGGGGGGSTCDSGGYHLPSAACHQSSPRGLFMSPS